MVLAEGCGYIESTPVPCQYRSAQSGSLSLYHRPRLSAQASAVAVGVYDSGHGVRACSEYGVYTVGCMYGSFFHAFGDHALGDCCFKKLSCIIRGKFSATEKSANMITLSAAHPHPTDNPTHLMHSLHNGSLRR